VWSTVSLRFSLAFSSLFNFSASLTDILFFPWFYSTHSLQPYSLRSVFAFPHIVTFIVVTWKSAPFPSCWRDSHSIVTCLNNWHYSLNNCSRNNCSIMVWLITVVYLNWNSITAATIFIVFAYQTLCNFSCSRCSFIHNKYSVRSHLVLLLPSQTRSNHFSNYLISHSMAVPFIVACSVSLLHK
jgi:hypothetical protein